MNIAEAALALSQSGRSDKERLVVLLDLEDSLDKGRSLIGDSGRESMPSINEKTEMVRKEIRTIIDSLPPEEAKRLMEERGESLKTQFSLR